MGKKITYKLKLNDKTNVINVPIGNDFFPVDNTELVNQKVDKIVQKSINNIDDWEKTMYKVKCEGEEQGTCFELSLDLWDSANGSTTDDWVGGGMFLEEDVEFKTNRFRGSFFRISYFTTPHRETQKLVSYANIPLLNQTTASFKICNETPGGSLFFWKSEKKLNITQNRLYMKVEFFNSADGGVDTFATLLPDSTGSFPIEYYNESMDYMPVLLNHKTRTFQYEPVAYWYDDITTQELYSIQLIGLCSLTLIIKSLHSITGGGVNLPPLNQLRMGSTTNNYSVPPLPQQQVLEEVVSTPQPTTLTNLIPSLPPGAIRSIRRIRKIFPTFGAKSLITSYSGGTITQETANY
tara:strand:- start:1288 stop:2340 length:1053 start_codon:yes stop_codon:yes gene_type:complete